MIIFLCSDMRRVALTICFAVFFICNISAQSYGLQFNSHESLAEKRTALELTPNDSLFFSKDVKLSFDINFIPGHEIYFGYVLRIINDGENIDIIYDQSTSMFRIITGENFSGISFTLDSADLYNGWSNIDILLQKSKQKLQVFVNKKPVGFVHFPFKTNNYKFLWGANDFSNYQTRDIPPMRIKDIKLFNDDQLEYYWPLNEVAGNTSADVIRKKNAAIKNAVWIKPAHQNWSLVNSYTIKGNAITAFDVQSETLYIAAADSVLTYNLKTAQNAWQRNPVKSINLLAGSQAIYDTITHKLLDVYIDEKKVISYKPGSVEWNNRFYDSVPTEYGHANKFISKADTSLYIVGGYGQLKYKNIVQRYSIPKTTWEVLKTKGDFFPPRYLSALGLNATGDTAFIIGGYGSPSGEQMLNPGNYSDMYAFDIKSKSFKKLFNLENVFSKYAFANSLVIDSKNQEYYGLVFPNDSFNSNLQLVYGSLKNPVVKFVATKIPYSFYDAQSFADLYYAPGAGKLIAVTIFGPKFEDTAKQSSTVKIYTLDFPPDLGISSAHSVPSNKTKYPLFIFSVLALVAIGFFILKRKKRNTINVIAPSLITPLFEKNVTELSPVVNEVSPVETIQTETPLPELIPAEEIKTHSAVLLFGQFQVFDKEGIDITELFTPLIKELFLLIVIYTFRNGRGITSEELNEILWSDKSLKDAKNNRSVNMAKLKKILERVGDCAPVKKSGFWHFEIGENFVLCDYHNYVHLLSSAPENDKDLIEELLKMTDKGSFLLQTEYNWLDDIKAEISNSIISACLVFLQHNHIDNPELTIHIANCIFYFDQLNEDALEYKCKSLIQLKRHALANNTYLKYIKDYKAIYGEEFEKTFNQIIKTDSENHLTEKISN